MKNKILLSLLFLPLFHFAQDSKGNCSSVKRHQNVQLKSNTFSVSQIAETEKYDVHYYFLNLNMTNTSTTLSGSAEIGQTTGTMTQVPVPPVCSAESASGMPEAWRANSISTC